MNTWQERLKQEEIELRQKVEKLDTFLEKEHSDTTDQEDIHDLEEQLIHMMRYLNILSKRVAKHVNKIT